MAINVTDVKTFKFYAHKVMPLVYDESLSYYEFLCKVMQKLNEVISSNNEQNTVLEDFDREINEWELETDELFQQYKARIDEEIEKMETAVMGMQVEASTLEAGSEVTVSIELNEQGNYVISFGIPQGEKGDTGYPTEQQIATAVTTWLVANVDPVGSAVVVDSSLSVSGAAADAKTVGDDLKVINTNIRDIIMRENKLYVETTIHSGLGYMDTQGRVQTDESTSCKYTDKIPCNPGNIFEYTGRSEYSVAGWLFYEGDVLKSYGQYNGTTLVIVPSYVDSVVFSSYSVTTNVDNVVLKFINKSMTSEQKSDIRETIEVYSEDEADGIFVKKENVQSPNLFDKTNIVTGEYLQLGGSVIQAVGYGHTDWIKLNAGTYIFPTNASYGGNKTVIQESIDGETYYASMSATLFTDSDLAYFTLNATMWVRFNIGLSVVDSIMLVEGDEISDYPSDYVPYYNYNAVEENIHLNETMKEEIAEITTVNPLRNKKISANGDSICWGNGYRGGYAKLISENNDMPYQNIGVGGGTLTAETYSGETARHWVSRTINNMDSNSDYILIEGGVNDASLNVTLGEISSGYNAVLDDTTFYGAVESIFKQVIIRFVGKKYCFIIPHQMTAGMNPTGNYYKAIYDCAEKWGMPIIDLSKVVPPFNSFRNESALNDIRTTYTTDGDGWHPTELCYKKYYVPKIEAFLKQM